MNRGVATWIGSAALLAACSGAPVDDFGDGAMALPAVLREVSGIVALDADTLACVQDEHGAIFLVDLRGVAAPRAMVFGPRGDYEGLARAGRDWWVLRSDGWLARLVERDGQLAVGASTWLPGGPREWEALCHDPARQRLLVIPKTGGGDDKETRDLRPIHAVDAATGAVAAEPVLTLSRRGLIKQAEARGLELPMRTTDKGKERVAFEFACSELAVVPGSSDLLLLCAADGVLLRVDAEGRLLACRCLDAALLPQAEAMAFLPDGRLVVASEGRGGSARVVIVPVP